jgi:tRNA(Ile)-lysidine synthase
MQHPLQTVKKFLKRAYQGDQPILLGFSGGPDSLALLHLLLACGVKPHVAHVDHGWRVESHREAINLKKYAESLNLPFYLHRLDGLPPKEDVARQARLSFFQTVYQQWGCQALLLAHQRDDQSETVLKRIFEGASLVALGGIEPITTLHGMTVWRPLLGISKIDLQRWLDERDLRPLDDPSNRNSKYLRARMRQQIIPELSRQFGKEIHKNLCKLGEAAQELRQYLDRRVEKYFDRVQENEHEVIVEIEPPFEPFEVKVFLKKLAQQYGLPLSYPAIETLYKLLAGKKTGGKVGVGHRWVEVRGRCIAIKKN